MSIADWWAQQINGVYNALGRNVGYFADDLSLAGGHVLAYTGETIGGPSDWRVKSAFGPLEPATTYLLNRGIQPSWMTPDDAVTQQSADDPGISFPANNLPGLSDFFAFDKAPGEPSGGVDWPTVAIYGGGAVLALLAARRVFR